MKSLNLSSGDGSPWIRTLAALLQIQQQAHIGKSRAPSVPLPLCLLDASLCGIADVHSDVCSPSPYPNNKIIMDLPLIFCLLDSRGRICAISIYVGLNCDKTGYCCCYVCIRLCLLYISGKLVYARAKQNGSRFRLKTGSWHVKQAIYKQATVICMLKFLHFHHITKTLLQIFVQNILPNFCRTVRVVGVFGSMQTNPKLTSDSYKKRQKVIAGNGTVSFCTSVWAFPEGGFPYYYKRSSSPYNLP